MIGDKISPTCKLGYSTNKMVDINRCMINKRRDVAIVDVFIPTNLVCILFDPAIPASSFNLIVFICL